MYDTLLFLNGGTQTDVLDGTQPWISRWIDRGVTDNNAPIFDGSYDWHSSVHARLAQVINLEEQGQINQIDDYANQEFPANLVQGEIAYNAQDAYGIAWLFQLDSKLIDYGISNLSPLADFHFGQLQARVERNVDNFIESNNINWFGSYNDANWMIMNAFNWGQDRGFNGVTSWAQNQFDSYANSINWSNIDILQGDFFSSVGIAALTHVTMGQTTGTAWNSILTSLESAIDSGRLQNLLDGNVGYRDAGALLSLSWGMWAAFSQTQDPAFYRAYEEITIWADENMADWGADFATSGHWLPNFTAFGLDLPTEIPVDWTVALQQAFDVYDGVDNGTIFGTNGDEFIAGTNEDDFIDGQGGNDVLYGGFGNDTLDGGGGDYNQVDYDGALSEYAFEQNADGTVTVTHPQWGTDTLIDIDGFWFRGEGQWYSMADALAQAGDGNGGGNTGGNIFNGTNAQDVWVATNADETFNGGNGTEYDQVDYRGSLSDYTFTQNADGSVTVDGFESTDTLTSIEGIWFQGEAAWYSVDNAVALTGGTGGGNTGGNVFNGTAAQDVWIATNADETFNGGNGAEYDQVDYAGTANDYDFVRNTDGSYTVTGFGSTDTLISIEGIWFQGSAEWAALDALV